MTEIVIDKPPIYEEAAAVFPLNGREIFAWGDTDTIYNPGGHNIPEYLIEHEKEHFRQHRDYGGSMPWWARYLVDAEFRYEQELEAHQREYRAFCAMYKDRNKRALYLMRIAKRLTSPLYGSVGTAKEARRAIQGGK